MSSNNRGPMILGVTWTLLIISGLFLSLRLYCKIGRNRKIWWDDCTLIFAWICLLITAGLYISLVSLGFGTHVATIPVTNFVQMGLVGNLSGLFSILAAIYSKTSFGLTMVRISTGWARIFVWAVIISINLAMGLNILISWIQCTPVRKNWDPSVIGTCWNPKIYLNYSIAAAVYSGAMDILLSIMPWTTLWKLQMKPKEKIGVGVAMSMGIFAGIAAMVKASFLPLMADGDFSYVGANVVIWGFAESAISIIAASIPILRVLIREVSSAVYTRYGSGGGTRNQTYGAKSQAASVLKSRNRVDITSNGHMSGTRQGGTDEGSEKSILGSDMTGDLKGGKAGGMGTITLRTETKVEFKGIDSESGVVVEEFEMHNV